MSEWIQEGSEEYRVNTFGIEDSRRQFIMVDFVVVEAMANIGKNAFIIYCALVRFASKDRVCFPSWKRLQAVTGLGKHSVRNALRRLQDCGLIEATQRREGGSFSSNIYTLLDTTEWTPPCDKNTDVQKMDVHKPNNKLDVSSSELDPDPKEVSFGDSTVSQKTAETVAPSISGKVAKAPKKLEEEDWLVTTLREHLPPQIPFEIVDDQEYWIRIANLATEPFFSDRWLRPELNKMALYFDTHPRKAKRTPNGMRQFMANWFKRSLDRGY